MTTIPNWVAVAVPVLTAIVGGVIGFAGNWYTSRETVKQWRRNLKVEAYRGVASATTEFLHAATRLNGQTPGTPAAAEAYADLRAANRAADGAATFAQMVAPTDVQRPVSGAMAAGVAVYNGATAAPRPPQVQFQALADAYITWQDNFLSEAQNDLGFSGFVKMPGNRPLTQPVSFLGRHARFLLALGVLLAVVMLAWRLASS
ncbi:MAG TPA: hypothetical protein VGU71_07670 [Candidatus Dormibacteraeota bacterium]|nr:hypothetical protein [Candidatus Dormibacteraeota bacterium]